MVLYGRLLLASVVSIEVGKSVTPSVMIVVNMDHQARKPYGYLELATGHHHAYVPQYAIVDYLVRSANFPDHRSSSYYINLIAIRLHVTLK